MNKHLYRLVFNRSLGVIQVVAEIAKGSGGKGPGATGTSVAALRTLSFALWMMLGFVGFIPAGLAQVVADPNAQGNQKPTVLQAPNGVPVINIQTPSAAGVSRNRYSQFDVGTQGAILNNGRTNSQTQLAGWIGGNPWLATGTAKVILNEVNGPASQLNGYLEIGGDRAQLVIANPAGITCAGCGFINASRLTLTTGTPILSNGALDGYRVDGGTIRVEGNGLDATRTDYTDLIARSLQLNGGIWANQLHATLGTNVVNADASHIEATTPAAGTAPLFALDASALGGMYANKIALIGTEHGVGVRNAGTLGAQAGELTVTVDGRLENIGTLQARTDTRVSATGGVANAGTLSATRELTIDTPLDMDNSGGTLNAQRIEVDAASLRNRGGSIEQTGSQTLALNANTLTNREGGRIGMAAPATDTSTGSGSPGGSGSGTGAGTGGPGGGGTTPVPLPEPLPDGVLKIAGLLDNDGGTINSGGGVRVNIANGLDNSGGHLGLRGLTLTQGNLGNTGGELSIAGDASLHVKRIVNDGGRLEVAGALDIATQLLSNRSGQLSHSGTAPASVQVAGTLDNSAGVIASNAGTLTLDAGVFVNEEGRLEHAGTGGMTLEAGTLKGAGGTIATASALTLDAGQIDHQGAALGAAQYTITAGAFDNRGGTVTASGAGPNAITVTGALDNGWGGTIASNGDLTVSVATFGNARGSVQQAGTGTLAINATTLNGASGTLASNGALTITGETTDLRGGTTQAQRIGIETGTLVTADGTLTAAGSDPLVITARTALDNSAGQIGTNGALQLDAGALINANGVISAAGTASSQVAVATTLENSGGSLAATGDLVVAAQDVINRGGTIQSAAALTVTANGQLDNSAAGKLASGGNLALATPLLYNAGGTIQSAGSALAIDATTLHGAGGTIGSNGAVTLTGETTDLRGGTTSAQSITVDTGTLTTAGGRLTAAGTGPTSITARTGLDNSAGQIGTNGALQLNAGTLTNASGMISAAGASPSQVTAATTLNNAGGSLASTGDLTVDAQDIVNQGGTVQTAGALIVTADGRLDNSAAGTIASGGDMALTTPMLDNTHGTIQSAGSALSINATTLNGHAGTIASNGALTLTGETTDLRGSSTSAQSVTVNTGTLTTAGGRLIASGTSALAITAHTALDNSAGDIATNGAVQLTVGTLTNTDGSITAAGTDASNVQASGALDNTRGTLAVAGAGTVHGGTLTNTAGTLYSAGGLTVTSDGDVINRDAGRLQSNGGLTLTAGSTLDNTAGVIDATGAATVRAAQITNTGGQIVAGNAGQPDAALAVTTTGALTNAGGTIGNRGGDVTVQAGNVDNSAAGTLVAQRDLTINTAAVNNPNGTIYATRTLRYENVAGTLQNTGGQFGAGDTAWLNLANVSTTNGGRIQAGTVWLTTPTLDITGGEMAANTLHADLTTLIGLGRLYGAQWLDVGFSGDFTYASGQRFQGDGLLDLDVAGTFTNQGTLQTAGELDVAAANLINQGTINASNDAGTGLARLTIADALDNQTGASIEGDTVALTATDVANTGDIIGDVVGIEADTLSNGRDLGTALAARDYGEGFIGASQYLDLRIAQRLSNRDAEIFSGGDLSITGRTTGTRVGLLDNVSGRIQAEGDAYIAAEQLDNRRRVVATETYTLTPTEQAALYYESSWQRVAHVSDPMLAVLNTTFKEIIRQRWGHTNGCLVDSSVDSRCRPTGTDTPDDNPTAEIKQADTYQTGTRLAASGTSAGSELVTGGDLVIDTGTQVTNYASRIAAGGNLLIDGQSVDPNAPDARFANIAVTGIYTGDRATSAWIHNPSAPVRYYDGNWSSDVADFAATMHEAITAEGPVLAAGSITAGGGVTILAGDVTNTSVSTSAGLSSFRTNGSLASPGTGIDTGSVGGGSSTGPQSPTDIAPRTDVGSGSGPTTAAPQVVGTAEHPLPGLVPADNGMFDTNADPNSLFLVTTAPRFAGNASGSNYLLSLLGVDTFLHKRLGDGYYEQRLVMEQILQLTGRRSLAGNGNGDVQYRELMNNAAQEAARLGLSLGVALTSSQIAALDHDVVWLVEMDVNGQTVLVPVVYLSKATAARLAAQGALMAGDTLDIQSSTTVHNDGTLTSNRGTWLSADTLINDGTIHSGGRVAIATVGDTFNRGQIEGHTVTIDAGGSVINTVKLDGLHATGGVINTGSGGLQISAVQDVVNQGQIASAGHGIVSAGRDFIQNTTTAHTVAGSVQGPAGSFTTAGSAVVTAGRDVVLDQSSITAGQHAIIDAGRDAHFTASDMKAGGSIAVTAGRDITSHTVTTSETTQTYEKKGKTRTTTTTVDETVHGTTFQAGGDIAMVAKNDITLTAVTATSKDGRIAISAGHDLTLNTADETHSVVTDSTKKKSGLLSSTTTKKHDEVTDTYAVGTTLSGERVDLSAGNDMLLEGAVAAGDKGVSLVAGGNIDLEAATNTHTESHSKDTKTSGVFGNGGIGFTIGQRKTGNSLDVTETTHTGTLIGSSEGRVDIVAGKDVMITGSDVLSNTGTLISGENVTIQHVGDTLDVKQGQYAKQGGINVSLKGGVVDTAMAVYGAAKRANEVEDDRLKGLYAAKTAQTLFSGGAGSGINQLGDAGQQLKDLGEAIQTKGQSAKDASGGISLRIGIGGSSSQSETTSHETSAHGSTIRSNGDVAIVAREGDLTVTGSRVEGENVGLAAKHDIVLQSAEEAAQQKERSKAASGEIGITVGTEAGIGVYVSASAARGKGNGEGTTHAETVIQGNKSVSFVSGNDTTLQGAQIIGERVVGQVGGDLTIRSEQDTNDYQRKDQSAGVDVAVGIGGGSVAVNYAQSKVNSNYKSVIEQSGIQAGSGGFQIDVNGHTQLDGGAIASTADPSKNYLSTGSLGYTDLKNTAEFKATSVSVSASGGSDGGGGGGSFMQQQDKVSSTTKAGIADGTLIVKDGSGTGISRGITELQQDGLKQIFDEQKTAETMEAGQVAGEVAFRAVGDYAQSRTKDYDQAQLEKKAAEQALAILNDPNATPQQKASITASPEQLRSVIANADQTMASNQAEYDKWKDGGSYKTIAHAVAGAFTAGMGGGSPLDGALGAAAAELARPLTADESTLVKDLVSLGIGGAAGGATGAGIGLAAEVNNRQLHESEIDRIKQMAGGDPRREAELLAAACAMVKCSAQYAPGTAEYAFWAPIEAEGNKAEYADEKAWLSMQGVEASRNYMGTTWTESESLFTYKALDAVSDWNARNQAGTRTLGGLQWLGGGLEATGGLLLASTCETGIGCVAAGYLGFAGVDNAQAGWQTMLNGRPTSTLGGQALQQLGFSSETAELVYGMTQLAPAGIDAYLANRAVNAQIAANAAARVTYTDSALAQRAASNVARFGYGAWDTLPDWQRAEVMALTDMENQGFKVTTVQRANGTGFDGFGYNPKTGEVMIGEVKNYTSQPCSTSACTALGMGGSPSVNPADRFNDNIREVLAKVEENPAFNDAEKDAIRQALRDGRYTVQLYGGSAGFKLNVTTELQQLNWLRNANIPPPNILPPVPPKAPTPRPGSAPNPPGG